MLLIDLQPLRLLLLTVGGAAVPLRGLTMALSHLAQGQAARGAAGGHGESAATRVADLLWRAGAGAR